MHLFPECITITEKILEKIIFKIFPVDANTGEIFLKK